VLRDRPCWKPYLRLAMHYRRAMRCSALPHGNRFKLHGYLPAVAGLTGTKVGRDSWPGREPRIETSRPLEGIRLWTLGSAWFSAAVTKDALLTFL
jgi:hypothetical protein